MSYIPDYRKETNKLTELDAEFIKGYRMAMADMKTFFDNVDSYEDLISEDDENLIDQLAEDFEDWCRIEEIETVFSIFESEEYDGVILVDANMPLYKNTKGAKANDKG